MKKYFLIFAALISLFCTSVFAYEPVLKNGEKAPSFDVKDIEGQSQSLTSHAGKWVVLEWFNPGCPFVKKHYGSGNMQGLQKKWTSQGVVWISVNSSAPGKQGNLTQEQAKDFMTQSQGSPSAVILDPAGSLGHLYGAATTPHMYIINPQGILVYQGAIDSKSGTDPSEISQAENYVDAALTESLAGDSVKTGQTNPYGCSVKYA